jgi:peroxiredoxin
MKMLKNKFVVVILIAGLCCAGAAWAELMKGEAPNFTLKSLKGDNLKLSEHRGEVIMLSFWATWCDKCKEGMPVLNDIYLKYRDKGFTVFSINTDKERAKVNKWLRGMNVAFPILLDEAHDVSKKYEVESMPMTYILDRDGHLRYMHDGFPEGYQDEFQKQVRELMEEY